MRSCPSCIKPDCSATGRSPDGSAPAHLYRHGVSRSDGESRRDRGERCPTGVPEPEHFIVTGGSRDGILGRLARHSQVRLVSDPGRGHASALNMGFSSASGAIWAILDAGDCLLPGALDVAAREIDPTRGHHVVMGRCQIGDARGRFVGIEHPCDFESHRRVLEIWRGHTVSRPAVFWAAEVWKTCGPMDESVAPAWLDYDLCCRFSRSYRFHRVDQVLATTRLHPHAGTALTTRAEALDAGIAVSRRYWGAPLRPMRWRLALSLRRYSFDRVARARRHVWRAKEKRRSGGRGLYVVTHAAAAVLLAPKVALYMGAYPAFRERASRVWRRPWTVSGSGASCPRRPRVISSRPKPGATAGWGRGWRSPVRSSGRQGWSGRGLRGSAAYDEAPRPDRASERAHDRTASGAPARRFPRADSSHGSSSAWGAHGGRRGEHLVRAR